ncbi:hypothetical protein SFRURICE_001802 [Spodoptera frugiperda]|nr:hypothetical protein SFRURICE_001802 [Spodoptera frugiperda]
MFVFTVDPGLRELQRCDGLFPLENNRRQLKVKIEICIESVEAARPGHGPSSVNAALVSRDVGLMKGNSEHWLLADNSKRNYVA